MPEFPNSLKSADFKRFTHGLHM